MFYRISLMLIILRETAIAAPSNLISPFAITSGNCEKNISVKYQVPVTRTRQNQQQTENDIYAYTEQFVEYEERTRWDTVHLCCPGYRTIIFGLCEPICAPTCPQHSYCAEPNKCVCMHGYEPSHLANKAHQLICRPICAGGCPDHSHCKTHNKCECRAGFKDVSVWFSQLRCERIQCPAADQRYDARKHTCTTIEMSAKIEMSPNIKMIVEEMMQEVGEKLSKTHVNTTTETYYDDEMYVEDIGSKIEV